MLQTALIGAGLGIALLAIWYGAFARFNRHRGRLVLRWLQEAIAAHGQVCGVAWISSSHFLARLNLAGSVFHQPFLEVRLAPRQMPVRWALWRWRRCQETLTFQANLSYPPGDSLQIARTRWFGLKRRWAKDVSAWPRQTVVTLFTSTQPNWAPQISGRINGVAAIRDFESLSVAFHPRPPHFSVTFSLEETMRHPGGELAIFDNLRELAQASHTSRL